MLAEIISAVTPESVVIQVVEATAWPAAPEYYGHYELVYIQAGVGCYSSDDQRYLYQPGDLFLLQSNYQNWFCSDQPTRFYVVRLPTSLVHEAHTALGEIPPVFAQCCFRGSPELSQEDRTHVSAQLEFCLREQAKSQAFGNGLVWANILSVLMLLRRAYIRQNPTLTLTASFSERQLSDIVDYVRQHLKDPARLSAAAIGAHFHQRPRQVAQYFRKHMGRGLKRFVEENRVYAIQQELRFTSKTISQLAFDYGFVDESHLSKMFKTITQQTPLRYRHAWEMSAAVSELYQLSPA